MLLRLSHWLRFRSLLLARGRLPDGVVRAPGIAAAADQLPPQSGFTPWGV